MLNSHRAVVRRSVRNDTSKATDRFCSLTIILINSLVRSFGGGKLRCIYFFPAGFAMPLWFSDQIQRLAEVVNASQVLRQSLGASAVGAAALAAAFLPYRDIWRERVMEVSKFSHSADGVQHTSVESSSAPNRRVSVIRALLFLLRVAVPRLRSRQGLYLVSLAVLLLVRTQLSIRIADQVGNVVQQLTSANRRSFVVSLLLFLAWTVPAAWVNSAIRYTTGMVAVHLREHLARYLNGRVLRQGVFFRVANAAVGGSDAELLDQTLTQQVQRWSEQCANVLTLVAKPLIDVVLFSRDLARMNQGDYRGPLMLTGYYAGVSVVLGVLAPSIGNLNHLQAQKDGELRRHYQTLLEYEREISVLGGWAAERERADVLFLRTNHQAEYIGVIRAALEALESLLVRNGSILIGYAICGWIVFSQPATASSDGVAALSGVYARSAAMLTNLAKAVGQVLLAYRSCSTLASLTHRVYAVEQLCENVERRRHHRHPRTTTDEEIALWERGDSTASGGRNVSASTYIRFDHVTLAPPHLEHAPLLRDLTFYVKPGMNLLIVGPNGAGKSSIFRVLAELWPVLDGGSLTKPTSDQLYYVCQRPYMSSGTLRDQVIYPTRTKDLKVGESELFRCLELAGLASLLDRPGLSWDSRKKWSGDALSHGEQQKLALARMFFHRPRFAIFDECTSAVDVDVEAGVYRACNERGITVISIAHRRTAWKYHNWVLKLDGCGSYVFSPMKLVEEPSGAPGSSATRLVLHFLSVHSATDAALVGTSFKEVVGTEGSQGTTGSYPPSPATPAGSSRGCQTPPA